MWLRVHFCQTAPSKTLSRGSETKPARLSPVAASPASEPTRSVKATRSGLGQASPTDGRPSGRAGEAAEKQQNDPAWR